MKSFSEAALNFLKRINILTEIRRPDGRSILVNGTDVGRKCSSKKIRVLRKEAAVIRQAKRDRSRRERCWRCLKSPFDCMKF